MKLLLYIWLILPSLNANDQLLQNIEVKLHNALDFINRKYNQIHFDGLLGVTFAHGTVFQFQAQWQIIIIVPFLYKNTFLRNSLTFPTSNITRKNTLTLIEKCELVHKKIYPLLPDDPEYMITFRHTLLDPDKWAKSIPNRFSFGEIKYLGYYKSWTSSTITANKKAFYKGVKSDICLREILELSTPNMYCYISKICWDMMLQPNRIDNGYLLTHRLLYLQIVRLQKCKLPDDIVIPATAQYTNAFCSNIYKEAVTSEILGYPSHDIFLEQVVLCGMEGFVEFLNEKWLNEIINWQTPQGCYKSLRVLGQNITKRTSFDTDFGCSDHTTGLGAAALALHFRFLLGLGLGLSPGRM